MRRPRLRTLLDAVARVPLWVTITLAVLVRLAADLVVPAADVDLYEFGVIAENVTGGRGWSYFAAGPGGVVIDDAHVGVPLASAFMPPLHTALVVAASALAGGGGGGPAGVVWLVRAANLALAVLLLLAVHRLVSRVASERAARFAVLGCVLYPVLVYQATQVSASNTYLPVEIGLLAVVAGLARRVRPGPLVAAGLLGAGLGLLRAEAVVLLVAIAAWLVAFAGGGWLGRRARVGVAAAFLVAALVPAAAWAVRSSAAFDRPVLTLTSTGGFNFWIGNHVGATGSQKDYTLPAPLAARLAALPPGPDYEPRRDAVFAEAAREYVAADPVGTLARDGRKLSMMVGIDPYDERGRSPAYLAGYAALVVLGVPGAMLWRREAPRRPRGRSADALLLGGWVLLSLAVPTVFFALARYRLPLELGLLMGASVLLARVSLRPVRPESRRYSGDDAAAQA